MDHEKDRRPKLTDIVNEFRLKLREIDTKIDYIIKSIREYYFDKEYEFQST